MMMVHAKIKIICALAVASVTTTSMAQAACWKTPAVSAARVRTMETMLMVSALRCKGTVLNSYNSFVRANRAVLDTVNATIKARFEAEGGLNAYDRYVTSIANSFGMGVTGMDCTALDGLLSKALVVSGNLVALNQLAEQNAVVPLLPGGACPVRAGLTG